MVEFSGATPRMQLQRVRLRHERVQLLTDGGSVDRTVACGRPVEAGQGGGAAAQLAAAVQGLKC